MSDATSNSGQVERPNSVISPKGLATGIGSLPHADAGEATAAVFKHLPECPFWPQLPKRSLLEGMVPQYVEGMPGLRQPENGGDPFVAADGTGLAELEPFYERVFGNQFDAFSLSEERAKGFYAFENALPGANLDKIKYLKGHITGPVTLASSLKDQAGREITHDENFREAAANLLAQKARWQIERLKSFGKPLIIFMDEPVMEVFGSAYSSLSAELVAALWAPVMETCRENGSALGVHCCGNTDWGLLFKTGLDIVNFDAFRYMDKMLLYPEELSKHMAAGGVLAWGIAPTDEAAWELNAGDLLKRLDHGIKKLTEQGVSEALLRKQSMLTPSCGMGSLSTALAEHILTLLKDVSCSFEA